MSEANVAIARRWFEEVWNQRREETIEELIGPESVCYAGSGELRGPGPFRTQVFQPFIAAFPDLHVEVVGTVAEGDQVVVRWTATGVHQGGGLGMPPSGRGISFRGMTWIRFADGKMIEGWDCWDQGGLLESLR